MSYAGKEMDQGRTVEISQSLQKRRQDKTLEGPVAAVLNQFIAASTARLTAQEITPDEHNQEVTLLAIRQREIDPFTGMYNKEGFRNEMTAAIEVARDLGISLTLLIVDGDGFGNINKDPALGYAIGDRTIKAISKAIQNSARRASDIKAHIGDEDTNKPISSQARQGGDEFAVLLLNTTLEEAQVVIEKIRNEVEEVTDAEVPEYKEHYKRSVKVSIGCAQFDPELDDANSLAARTDLSLQKEKLLKKYGNIPQPDLSDLLKTGKWIQKWVKIPYAPLEGSSSDPNQRLIQEHNSLIIFAQYAYEHPEARESVLDMLVKAAIKKPT